MRITENSIVPYPSSAITTQPVGELEEAFMSLLVRDDSFLNYPDLPLYLRSTAIDAYMTWLNQLTQADPLKRERGSSIHLRIRDGAMIFPINPIIGDEKSVVAPEARYYGTWVPLVRLHSHPDFSCFSTQDLIRIMSSESALAEGVATNDANYLIIKTNQSKREDPSIVVEKMEEQSASIQRIADTRYAELTRDLREEFPDLHEEATRNALLTHEKSLLGRDFMTHFATFSHTKIVADHYRLGFYVSNRRGEFHLFNDAMFRVIRNTGHTILENGFQIYRTKS